MHIGIVGKPLYMFSISLDLDTCMKTLTSKVAQEVIETVNKNYTKNMYVSAASTALGMGCGVYYMTLQALHSKPLLT